jgi:hypothetical protein
MCSHKSFYIPFVGGFTDVEVELDLASHNVPRPTVEYFPPDANFMVPHSTNNLVTRKLTGDRCLIAAFNFTTGLAVG